MEFLRYICCCFGEAFRKIGAEQTTVLSGGLGSGCNIEMSKVESNFLSSYRYVGVATQAAFSVMLFPAARKFIFIKTFEE